MKITSEKFRLVLKIIAKHVKLMYATVIAHARLCLHHLTRCQLKRVQPLAVLS